MANNGQLNSCIDLAMPERRLVFKTSVDLNVIGHEIKVLRAVAAKASCDHSLDILRSGIIVANADLELSEGSIESLDDSICPIFA